MKRDIRKAITEGENIINKNERLDIRVTEMRQIREFCQANTEDETVYNLIMKSYAAGLAVGIGNGRRGGIA